MNAQGLRSDLAIIADHVAPGARVIDIGCGDGALMAALRDRKGVDARGIEISRAGVSAAVARGLAVVQGDADTDLADYPSDTFDYAILSQTLQTTRAPDRVMTEMLRIARVEWLATRDSGALARRVREVVATQPLSPRDTLILASVLWAPLGHQAEADAVAARVRPGPGRPAIDLQQVLTARQQLLGPATDDSAVAAWLARVTSSSGGPR